jgi:hypothetical protein
VAFIRWERPRGAVHDLTKALSLRETGCNVLILSDASFYVLQNWLALDLSFKARWACAAYEHGYNPIEESLPEYGDWVNLIEQIQVECKDVSCDLVGALEAIKDAIEAQTLAIEAQTTQQEPWDDILGQIAGYLELAPTGQQLLSLAPAMDSYGICCDDATQRPYYDVSASELANPGDNPFCERCYSYALDFLDVGQELMEKWSAGQIVTVSVLALIAAALALPLTLILSILGIIAIAIFEVAKEDYQDFLISLVDDIACAVYNAASAAEALTEVKAVIADATKPDLWPEPAATLVLQYLVSQDAINQIFDETYPVRPDAEGNDCAECDYPQEGDCDTVNHLVYGTGILNVPGTSTITPQDVSGWYRIELHLKRGMCFKVTSGPSAQEYKYYRCQSGSFSGPYKTQGAPDNVWSCCGKFTLLSDVSTSVTFVIGDDDCVDDDLLCP